MTPPPRLGALTGGHDNNFQLLRLLAALAVVLFHCYALTGRWTDEPLWRLAHDQNLGALGVEIFFVVSGFLVTQSWLTRRRLDQFVMARVLRVYPALIAATLLTIALGAASSKLPWAGFLANPQTGDYFWHTALGVDVRDRLPGAFAANPYPHVVNGSLWTLPVELRLYLALAAAGVAGLLAHRLSWLAAAAAALAALYAWPAQAIDLLAGHGAAIVLRLAALFLLGSLAYAWRDVLPVSLAAGLAALGLMAWNPGGYPRGILFAPLLAYVVLVLAYDPRLRLRAFNRVGDYSYGLYVYSFPLQQTVVERMPGVAPLALFAWALPAALAVAIVSWHALEQPALGLKSRFDLRWRTS
jgi:peptidoglycan/LPS O-acetylase OafA/YrhL